MKYINLFDTQAAYDAANKYYPNVSYIEATDEVVYQENAPTPPTPTYDIVAKFRTISKNQNVTLTNHLEYFSDIIVEGTSQSLAGTGNLNFTFATAGLHEVAFNLIDNTSIPGETFKSVPFMETVTIGSTVTNIGYQAFFSCTSMSEMTCLATTPPTLGLNALYWIPSTSPIFVPAASVNAYKAASGWSDRASYIEAIS